MTDHTAGGQEPYQTTVRFLDPGEIRLSRNAFGKLVLDVDGEHYEGVELSRAFPHTAPDHLLSLKGPDGKEIGMLEDPSLLDSSSRQALEAEMDLAYFSPLIRRITKIVQHYGATSWHVETDRGPQVVRIRERGDIRWPTSYTVVLSDVHGVRYEIPDISALDEDSRTLLEQES